MGNSLKSMEGGLQSLTPQARASAEGRVTITWELLVSAWLGSRGKGGAIKQRQRSSSDNSSQ